MQAHMGSPRLRSGQALRLRKMSRFASHLAPLRMTLWLNETDIRGLLQRKSIQERQVLRENRKPSKYQQRSQQDQQHSAADLNRVHMSAKAAIELEEALDT